ncbi:unnamed protein product [Camellia sinensis]
MVDMPLNSFPSTVSKETFELKIKAAAKRIYVDVDWQWWKTVRAASEDLILYFWKYFDIGFWALKHMSEFCYLKLHWLVLFLSGRLLPVGCY